MSLVLDQKNKMKVKKSRKETKVMDEKGSETPSTCRPTLGRGSWTGTPWGGVGRGLV